MSQSHSDNERIGGFHAVVSVLESDRPVRRLWLAAGRHGGRHDKLVMLAEARGVPVDNVAMDRLDAWLPNVRHQGCVIELEPAREYKESELPALLAAVDSPMVLALDQVQDPHNLGACLRSAAAAGVHAVIAPRKRAAGLTAAARKVAAGAAERVPFVPVTNLARALQRLQAEGFWVVGLDGEAESSIYETDLPEPVVWVAGGEAKGLRELTAKHCDLLVFIPMAGGMESLNVSVATAVALFETVRRRRAANY
ncbi:23S rRNA (guanosine(2251)-2'-O)-methyltransferase RlmB [Salinisphaera sp.]|uniref:23S rRNA (guanosine(2251)-2'-O)-methyltransferase RlmB n=1 Tax=Salinisphaera sp. TaxID=1914330 RepID=UPI002D79F733|nr:23S rRNA (guanosine(2251)-2'-O)-methyltransferase RlmB [Salinisphaera sp.]HET7312834.1 23S rRNA (guanosine(2251)-2'-O)-methyltransferase RlmB [Salinisphaera sp.]